LTIFALLFCSGGSELVFRAIGRGPAPSSFERRYWNRIPAHALKIDRAVIRRSSKLASTFDRLPIVNPHSLPTAIAPIRAEGLGPEGLGAFQGGKLEANWQGHGTITRNDGQVLARSTPHTDSLGRRLTVNPHPETRRKYAAFFGCSFAYGHGLEDVDTLPSQFARAAPGYAAYNYGFEGLGPSEILTQLRRIDFRSEIPQRDGLGIYVFISDHIRRSAPRLSAHLEFPERPYYWEAPDGRVSSAPSFQAAHPLVADLFRVLSSSSTLNYFRVDFPLTLDEGDVRHTALLLKEMSAEYERRFGNRRFLVLLYPSQSVPALTDYLDFFGVPYLDYSQRDLATLMTEPASIPGDGHPSAAANRFLASVLARDVTRP
jgi:hypothetical protein